jgi:uncharacterized protein involved in cysteine biosynthesis
MARFGIDRVLNGFRTFRSSFRFVAEHGLGGRVMAPIIAGFALSALLIGLVVLVSAPLAAKAQAALPEGLPDWTEPFLRAGMLAIGLIGLVFVYRPLVSVLVLPFVATTLNRVEEILLGREIQTTLGADVKNALIGGWLGLQASFLGLIVLVTTIPLGPFQGAVMFFVNSYILGKSVFDFVFEKESDSVEDRRRLIRAYRPEILGVGMGFFLLLLVPVLGAAIAPVYSVIAAARIRHASPGH